MSDSDSESNNSNVENSYEEENMNQSGKFVMKPPSDSDEDDGDGNEAEENGMNSDDNESENEEEDENGTNSDDNQEKKDNNSKSTKKQQNKKLNGKTAENGDVEKVEKPDKHKCEDVTWADLGLSDTLTEVLRDMKWLHPTKIQKEAIPVALKGNDIIGLAETGSGKTGAFALPIMQSLFETPQKYFALVLTPTRELAFQIAEQFEALGSSHGLKVCVIVGGMDMVSQALQLAKRPHIVIATPGRLVDHLENTKGFNLKAIKYLVMDEADRILNMDFEMEVNKILKVIPKERRTYLFSATMTKKVKKLQRASLQNPVLVEVSNKFQTVSTLQAHYLFIPLKHREIYLVYILNELAGNSFMIFCGTCAATIKLALMIRSLGMAAIPLHGQMSQNKRLAALNKFKSKSRSILVSTDVASRGLDIPHVDVVINYDIPTHSKDYIHRVGRTARNGAAGKAITLVTQYDVELYQRIEHLLGYQLPLYKVEEDSVMMLQDRVNEALRTAKLEQKNLENNKLLSKEKRTLEDDGEEMGALSKRAKIFKDKKQSYKKMKGKRRK